MADMTDPDDVYACWDELQAAGITDPSTPASAGLRAGVIPVTYMNSAAALKAFCGRNGGIVCTSSNAEGAMRWALARGEKLLFFPDQHLGRNTALKLGYSIDDMLVWNPRRPLGGHTAEEIARAKIILWRSEERRVG